mgnify:CR=1 FL=1
MKAVLLHIFEDDGLDSRLAVALDMCRAHDAHLSCVYVTPYAAYVGLDPMGGVFASGPIVQSLRDAEDQTRARVEKRLAQEDVRWDWQSYDGDPAQTLVSVSALADVLIVSQTQDAKGGTPPLPLVDAVAVNGGCPVLVVPTSVTRFDATAPIVIGWNDSEEAARAIREALPALKLAQSVTLVSVGEEEAVYPQTEASTYLARHGIKSDLQSVPASAGPADAILRDIAEQLGASAILIGAYGHSRLRETLLGGVTRRLVTHSTTPILLGH